MNNLYDEDLYLTFEERLESIGTQKLWKEIEKRVANRLSLYVPQVRNNFENGFYFPLGMRNKITFLRLILVSWYLKTFGELLRVSIEEILPKNNSDYNVVYTALKSKELTVKALMMETNGNIRSLNGGLANETLIIRDLEIIFSNPKMKRRRPPKFVNRPLGYNDKGSKRSSQLLDPELLPFYTPQELIEWDRLVFNVQLILFELRISELGSSKDWSTLRSMI